MSTKIICEKNQEFKYTKIFKDNNLYVKKYREFYLDKLFYQYKKNNIKEFLYVKDIKNRILLLNNIFKDLYNEQILYTHLNNNKLCIFSQQLYVKYNYVYTCMLINFMKKYNFILPSKLLYLDLIQQLYLVDDYEQCYNDQRYMIFINFQKNIVLYDVHHNNISYINNNLFLYDIELYFFQDFNNINFNRYV